MPRTLMGTPLCPSYRAPILRTARFVRTSPNDAIGLDEQDHPVAVLYRDHPQAPWTLEAQGMTISGFRIG